MDLKKVLADHALWLHGDAQGVRANLWRANLAGSDLAGSDLRHANLWHADLRHADLTGADLQCANLQGANLTGANLWGANLWGANLTGADLSRADLSRADLSRANLSRANLTGCKLPHFQIVPSEGAFVAWKKVSGAVLKLRVLGKRTSSLVGRKCRCSRARVLAWSEDGKKWSKEPREFESLHDPKFKYVVGSEVRVEDYDSDIRVECTRGIHFYMTLEECR